MPRFENNNGEAVYFNLVEKNAKPVWVIKGIGETTIFGRDRQKRKSRIFTQLAQAEAYLAKHGFTQATY